MLTKSNYLLGIQCLRLLWTYKNDKDAMPKPSEELQHRFDQGQEVGELAKLLFPKGIDIEDEDFKYNLKKTKEFLEKKVPLFEPSFLIDDLYARADILVPKGKKWDIIEVKSATSVKDINIHDLAFQRYVYEKAGLKIRKCYLMHLNKEYRKKGKVSARKLFTLTELTEEVKKFSIDIEKNIDVMQTVLNGEMPQISIGVQCNKPYACQLKKECWSYLPKGNVTELYYGGKKSYQLLEEGVLEIKDIPKDFKLSEKQKIQTKGKIHIDKKGIKKWLDKLEKPLYFLDFETFQTAIPMYEGTKPYQQIPFQYSLHVLDRELKQYEYLAKGGRDPRGHFLNSLKRRLGHKGSIIVYNKAFEMMILRELDCHDFDERIVDLLDIFRGFYYYNPKQEGSCSIKKVLPCFSDLNYQELDISHGGQASLEFFKNFSDVKVRKALLKYCELDTYSEVIILEKLEKL